MKVLVAPNGKRITHANITLQCKALIHDIQPMGGGIGFSWKESTLEFPALDEEATEGEDEQGRGFILYDEDGQDWGSWECTFREPAPA